MTRKPKEVDVHDLTTPEVLCVACAPGIKSVMKINENEDVGVYCFYISFGYFFAIMKIAI